MRQYSLGAIGTGHWFERLYVGMKRSGAILVTKAAGAKGIEGKEDRLSSMGISSENYYKIPEGSKIPEDFFKGLDIVHISDPNEFHAPQTIQSLGKNKITVTEKTWGVNRAEFSDVCRHIRESGMEGRAYLHLHYIHKTLTTGLESILARYSEQEGRIGKVSATFFETVRDEDIRRKDWLLSADNGGIFMDWIHPFEILRFGARADTLKLGSAEQFIVNPNYSDTDPTGIHARLKVSGKYFSNAATASLRLAKGASEGRKSVRFVFESGNYLDLDYADSEVEFSSKDRGSWTFYRDGKPAESARPTGPDTSELLVSDIIAMCKGGRAGMGLEDASALFEPQWEYQRISRGRRPISETAAVGEFIGAGLDLTTG